MDEKYVNSNKKRRRRTEKISSFRKELSRWIIKWNYPQNELKVFVNKVYKEMRLRRTAVI